MLDTERIGRIRVAMRQAGFEGLLCALPENILLLTGYLPRMGASIVWLPVDGDPVVLLPETELDAAREAGHANTNLRAYSELEGALPPARFSRFLEDCARQRSGLIGVEAGFGQIAPPPLAGEIRTLDKAFMLRIESAFGADRLRDSAPMLYTLRARKTAHEIGKLRRAHEVTAVGLSTFRKMVEPGRTEIEIAAEVERTIAVAGMVFFGASSARAWAQICSGKATDMAWRSYAQPGSRTLEAGDLVVLELGVVVDGFWTDLTRVRVAGEANDRQREIWAIVQDAQQAAVDMIKPGVQARVVDNAARSRIGAQGYRPHFPHITGHGLGFRYHEPIPILGKDSEHILEEGMVTSVEPGIYIPGWGGIRVEDNILVTASEAERLSPSPYGLEG